MKNINLPADHRRILFTDDKGIEHKGIYNQSLKAFIEPVGDDTSEDAGNTYMENEVTEWQYMEENSNPDADIMIIF